MADVINTADNIALCNQALGYLGAQQIAVDGSSANYNYCETFFAAARDEILALHKWNFAKKRAYAIQTTDPLHGYNNAFTKPTDCIRMWRIDDDDHAKWEMEGSLILTDRGDAPPDYDEDGVDYLAGQYFSSDFSDADLTYLVDTAFTSSDEEDDIDDYCTVTAGDLKILKVEYVYKLATPADWPVQIQTCFVYNLALKLCGPIKNAEERTLAIYGMLHGSPKSTSYLDKCKSQDAQEGGGTVISTSRWLNSRRSGSGRANVGILE